MAASTTGGSGVRTESGDESSPSLLSIAKTAHLLTVSPRSVWRWIAAGEIKAVRLGRAVRIPASEIDRIARQGVPR